MIWCILFHFKRLRYVVFLSIKDTAAFIIDFFVKCYVCSEYFVTSYLPPKEDTTASALWQTRSQCCPWWYLDASIRAPPTGHSHSIKIQDHFANIAYQINWSATETQVYVHILEWGLLLGKHSTGNDYVLPRIADGRSEWSNQTIISALRCAIVEQSDRFHFGDLILAIIYAWNTSPNASSCVSLYELRYERPPKSVFS